MILALFITIGDTIKYIFFGSITNKSLLNTPRAISRYYSLYFGFKTNQMNFTMHYSMYFGSKLRKVTLRVTLFTNFWSNLTLALI